MVLSHFPIMFVDVLGSFLVIIFSIFMVRNFAKNFKRSPSNAMAVYLFWFAASLFIFALSRSMGHILKHILFFTGRTHVWTTISPYSGAVNTIAIAFMAAVTMFFKRMLGIFRAMEHDQRKIAEASRELLRLNEQMNQLVGERTRSEMVLRLAHEIRNPITIIGGLLRRVEKGISDDEKFKKSYIPKILEQAGRLEDIVRRFEEVLSKKTRSFVVLDLNELALRCIDQTKEMASKKEISLDFEGADQPLFFKGNREILELSIRHLIDNAIEACKRGDNIKVTASPSLDGVVLEVSDTGPGIPKEVLDHIFEPVFETRKGKIGLGLSFVKQVVEEHNGVLKVETIPGKGTTIVMEFPTYLREEPMN